MRLIVLLVLPLLILPSLAFAEPASKQADKADVEVQIPNVELKLSSTNRDVVEITIQNNDQESLELPYRVSPFEHIVVELRGENGKQHKSEHTGEKVGKADPGTLTVPADPVFSRLPLLSVTRGSGSEGHFHRPAKTRRQDDRIETIDRRSLTHVTDCTWIVANPCRGQINVIAAQEKK